MTAIATTELAGLTLKARGKVRDIYDLGEELLIVSTDRLSAFDVVFAEPIPDKGKVLNQLSDFWFDRLAGVVDNHLVTADAARFPASLRAHEAVLRGRSMLVRKAEMFPVECVARGYLAGSGWKEYRQSGTVCGIPLPPDLQDSSRLPQPIFTPATKAVSGHDENISFDEMVRIVGRAEAVALRDLTLELFRRATEFAESRGVLLADTKFEFGRIGGKIVLADEALTPDSSRYWPAEAYAPGRGQVSWDKQFVRDYVEGLGWNKQPPPPPLPPAIVEGTRQRYLEIFGLLTGRPIT
jgi:phosphoribosylaminoimidazole-succinocarboxamide synthase